MSSIRKIVFISLFLAVKVIVCCQISPDLKLVTQTKDYKIQERVLLTFDQDFYLAGESINFAALTFDAAIQIPINFSSILYVELFNQDNNVIAAKKYELNNGEGLNSITIPRQLETGYYYVRAYTNFMKNFGQGIFATKRIKVVNPFTRIRYQDNTEDASKKMQLTTSIEGGKLIYGISNKIAFHTTILNNRILALLYKNDSVIAQIESKDGFGIFNLTPTISNKYRIEAVSTNKEKVSVELGNIVQSGVICKLDSVNNRAAYLKVVSKNYDKFPISVFIENNSFLYEYTSKVNNSETSLQIALPVGLNKIILKNNNQEEVSERFVYIEPESTIKITAKTDKLKAMPNDSIVINLSSDSKDSIQYVVGMTLGNKETAPSLQELMEGTLYNSAIYTFTNKISVNEQQYIFSNKKHINDFLLKLQNTESINNRENKIVYFPEINMDIISGSVSRSIDNSRAANKTLNLAFVDSICMMYRSKTDTVGNFVASLPVRFQQNNLIVTLKDTTDNYLIKLDDEFYSGFSKIVKDNYYPDSTLKDIIQLRMLNMQVSDAYSEHTKNVKSRSALRFYGYPDSEYKFKKYKTPNLEEFINEIVDNTRVIEKEKQLYISVFGNTSKNSIGDNPLIILDGIPLIRTKNIALIPSEKLESIRVIHNKLFWGLDVYDGVVDITSNSKKFDLIDLDKNSVRVIFNPVITERNNFIQLNPRTPNYISNVYYNIVTSDTDGKRIKIQLPQNTGSYSISVFGYTKNGNWGSIIVPNALTIKHDLKD